MAEDRQSRWKPRPLVHRRARLRRVLAFPTAPVAEVEEMRVSDVLAESLSHGELRTRCELKGDVLRLLDTARRIGARRSRVLSLARRVSHGSAHCLELEKLEKRLRRWLRGRRRLDEAMAARASAC